MPLGSRGNLLTFGNMIVIRFSDPDKEASGLGFLAKRFPGRTWANGDTLVPEAALAPLAEAGFRFTVEGRMPYDRAYAPLRNPAPAAL